MTNNDTKKYNELAHRLLNDSDLGYYVKYCGLTPHDEIDYIDDIKEDSVFLTFEYSGIDFTQEINDRTPYAEALDEFISMMYNVYEIENVELPDNNKR